MTTVTISLERVREVRRRLRTAERARPEILLYALEVLVEHLLDPATLTPEEIPAVAGVFPDWEVGVGYPLNRVLNYNGTLVKVLQAHTSQADWLPTATPTLYTAYHPPGAVPDWVQPQGAHDAKQIGDEVMHNGQRWVNTVANNVWEPGVHGWVLA